MARLRGHATDPPGRWKEPRAFAAADHAAQRARQGRGRRPIRRRVRGQCGGRRRRGGKSDPSRGRDTPAGDRDDRGGLRDCARWRWRAARTEASAGRRATRRRAIRVAAITRGADREEAVAASTDFLAKRRVHDVGAAARFDWTRRVKPWHKRDDWLGPSEHRGGHRGSGGFSSRPSPHPPHRRSLRDRRTIAQPEEAVDADAPVDAQNAPTAAWKSRWRTRDSHKRPQPSSFSLQKKKTKNELRHRVQIYAVSGER